MAPPGGVPEHRRLSNNEEQPVSNQVQQERHLTSMFDLPELPLNPLFDNLDADTFFEQEVAAGLQYVNNIVPSEEQQQNWHTKLPYAGIAPAQKNNSWLDGDGYNATDIHPYGPFTRTDDIPPMYQNISDGQLADILMKNMNEEDVEGAAEAEGNQATSVAPSHQFAQLSRSFPLAPQEVVPESQRRDEFKNRTGEEFDDEWLTAAIEKEEDFDEAEKPREALQEASDIETDIEQRVTRSKRRTTSSTPRKLRERKPIEPSDPHERVSAYHVFQPQTSRGVGRGHKNAGKNLMALYGDDITPRTKWPLIVDRGRKGPFFSENHPGLDQSIAARTSLEEICRNYPNHVWGTGLRLFMREEWDAERVWRLLPDGCKCRDAKVRKWNYIQQAMGREADKMWEESGEPRRKKSVDPKNARRSDGGDADDQAAASSTYQSHQTTSERRPSESGAGYPNKRQRFLEPSVLQPEGSEQHLLARPSPQAFGATLQNPAKSQNVLHDAVVELNQFCASMETFCMQQIRFKMQARDSQFRALPLPEQMQLATRAFQHCLLQKLNALINEHKLDKRNLVLKNRLDVFRAVLSVQRTTGDNANITAEQHIQIEIDSRRDYVALLRKCAEDLATEGQEVRKAQPAQQVGQYRPDPVDRFSQQMSLMPDFQGHPQQDRFGFDNFGQQYQQQAPFPQSQFAPQPASQHLQQINPAMPLNQMVGHPMDQQQMQQQPLCQHPLHVQYRQQMQAQEMQQHQLQHQQMQHYQMQQQQIHQPGNAAPNWFGAQMSPTSMPMAMHQQLLEMAHMQTSPSLPPEDVNNMRYDASMAPHFG